MPPRIASTSLLRRAAAPAALLTVFAGLFWLERRRPLRERRVEPARPRLVGNAAAGVIAALTVAVAEAPLSQRAVAAVERHRLGLVPRLGLPPLPARIATLLLLDYSLYGWHVLLHRLPGLWRWHRVHHADRDLDVTTALRFHAGELLWSVPWRLGQVLLIGVPRDTLALWSRLTLAEVLFHHSNLRLPERADRLLGRLLTTPRLHGIHHSDRPEHQHANLSSGLTLWDALHGTLRRDVAQQAITVGLPPEGAGPAR